MKIDFKAILKAAQENQSRLQGCVGPHFFVAVPDPLRKLFPDHKCQKCNGTMESIHVTQYIAGLKHGMNCTPADVKTAIEIRELSHQAHYDHARQQAGMNDAILYYTCAQCQKEFVSPHAGYMGLCKGCDQK